MVDEVEAKKELTGMDRDCQDTSRLIAFFILFILSILFAYSSH
jgi:hypothetical protein